MKKIVIILIALISVSALNANLPGREIAFTDFKNSFNLTRTHFNSLLQSTTVFSQEDYDVGDIIDITIHFEVNTTKNVGNLKFAVTDYKNKIFYVLYKRHFDTITKKDKEATYEYLTKHDTLCKFIESDPDLVLSNEQPKGVYNLKFKLTKKTKSITAFDKQYPYIFRSLDLYSYTKAEKYEYITDYKSPSKSLTIPIKINSAARKNEKPSQNPEIKSIPADKPKREFNKKQSNSNN